MSDQKNSKSNGTRETLIEYPFMHTNNKLELDKEQKEILKNVCLNKSMYVVTDPGTGKSSMYKLLKKIFQINKHKIISIGPYDHALSLTDKDYKEAKYLLVDASSQITAAVITSCDDQARIARGVQKLFGGIPFVFFSTKNV